MDVFDINKVLASLSQHKPIFQLEKDLQASFADEVMIVYPQAIVKREISYNSITGYIDDDFEQPEYANTTRTDVLVFLDGNIYLIELKYKTKLLSVNIRSQYYQLKKQGAHNDNRYWFLRDVERLEGYIANEYNGHKITEAYAIFVTNDAEYQKEKKPNSVIKDFDLSVGKIKTGVLRNSNKPKQTIFLAGTYIVNWAEFSHVPAEKNNVFWVSIFKTNEVVIGKS